MTRLVIDTNIVLDLYVFDDAAATPLRAALEAGEVEWLATAAMRAELSRVLGYPKIVPRLAFHARTAAGVLAAFDRHARIVDVPAKASVTCRDADDQCFIDLAVAHGVCLLSKDKAVRAMRRRMELLGAGSASCWPAKDGQRS